MDKPFFSDLTLQKIQTLWGLTAPLKFHRRVENFIYFSFINENEVVIRFTEKSRRSQGQVESELHWQDHLKKSGARVSTPLLSVNSRLVECLSDSDKDYFVCVFNRVIGLPLRDQADFTKENVMAWGRALASFHQATQSYTRTEETQPRPDWEESVENNIEQEILESLDSQEAQLWLQLKSWMKNLKRDEENFGLVHTDMHMGNFLCAEGEVTVFDLDDCSYHWFAYDYAVPLFYLRVFNDDRKMGLDIEKIEASFYEGYTQLRAVDKDWFFGVRNFFIYRMLVMYGWSKMQLREQKLDSSSLDWCHFYLTWFKDNFEDRVIE